MSQATSDKYDEAVKYLTENPEEIRSAWENPRTNDGGCLFGYCSHDGGATRANGRMCGCLTQIRVGASAETDELTAVIRSDSRIPEYVSQITVAHLPIFAKELEEKLFQAEASLRSAKCETIAERTKLESTERKLKRIKQGVCPCCNRSFQNLRRHLKTKHPQFIKK